MKAHIFRISAPLKEKAGYLAERVNKAERLQRLLQSPEALWIDCGGFRRVTPTIFQFLDNRSRIMLAAGANPIFAHTSLVVWELNQKHRMKGSFQDHLLLNQLLLPGEILSFPCSPRDFTLGKLIPWMDHNLYKG
ncbi:hypothetical protein KY290_005166 [Solanum tuberosum]|uniref:Uncharacterized protein n=1 Tax=Solanum tuberosum TaxID=4113 RepID=A0ABQ7WF58_SOLTU|nr:hypothetical protein KY289_029070 [Solanum tuberosum]KAH0669788.1 hypothetical protein KY289_024281 [Solanum tuberosum]KAH0704162.1 hypothetical protein KY285_018440 [Solanum tuberosum]KAH0751903.1 hypothetical protein KY285_005051 [Solanum tuberosum]KAH0778739.1 hypothetical protein KY290_005166 [Solanum tuberosum]